MKRQPSEWDKKLISITSWVLEDAQMFDFRKALNEAVILILVIQAFFSCPGSENCVPVVGKMCSQVHEACITERATYLQIRRDGSKDL